MKLRRLLHRFALWLLWKTDPDVALPKLPPVYAVVRDGERIAELTTNYLRGRCEAMACNARGERAQLIRLAAFERVRL